MDSYSRETLHDDFPTILWEESYTIMQNVWI